MAGEGVLKEAKAILDAFRNEWGMTVVPGDRIDPGPYIEGIKALQWLKDHFGKNFGEVEWAGFYVKRLAQCFCNNIPNFPLKPNDDGKNYRVTGEYLWDVRFHTNEGAEDLIPFRDIYGFNMDLEEWGGIGLIVLHCETTPDKDQSLLHFQEQLVGEISDYTRRVRLEEGKPPRTRKQGFFVLWGDAYYLTMEDFQNGYKQGWLSSNFQEDWRNSDKMPRHPKYFLDLDEIPPERLIYKVNFNVDPVENPDF